MLTQLRFPELLLPNHPLRIPGLGKAKDPALSTLLPDHAMLVLRWFGYFFRAETESVATQFRATHRSRRPALRARRGKPCSWALHMRRTLDLPPLVSALFSELLKRQDCAGKMAQQFQAFVIKPDDPISNPRHPHDGEKEPIPQVAL